MDASARHCGSLIRTLRIALGALPAGNGLLVAFSGGLDSSVLLHAVSRLAPDLGLPVRAAHVNHGLHPRAGEWADRCRETCADSGVDLQCVEIDARPPAGESPEARARAGRYAALAGLLGQGEILLTAHHRQDQAETLLLQMLRGAGPRGLASMAPCAPFAAGWHARPMLECPRRWIEAYAQRHGLRWCEDPSNRQPRYDRNFLRHQLLPRLAERWPGYATTLARAARWQADAAFILEQVAGADLGSVGGEGNNTLSIPRLLQLDPARRRNLLRFWLESRRLPVPHAAQLEELLKAIEVRNDAQVCVHWPGGEVRRFRGALHAMPGLPVPDPHLQLGWQDLSAPVELPWGRLEASLQPGRGLSPERLADCRVTIGFRRGGERCRPAGRAHSQTLKKLLQDYDVPPWLRPHLPLVYCGEALAAAADRWICEPFQARPGEPGWVLRWRIEPKNGDDPAG